MHQPLNNLAQMNGALNGYPNIHQAQLDARLAEIEERRQIAAREIRASCILTAAGLYQGGPPDRIVESAKVLEAYILGVAHDPSPR